MERTTLTLVQSLPGISRWFEVEKRELVSEDRTATHTHLAQGVLQYIFYFSGCNLVQANIQVLIQVITSNNNNDLGHGFGAIGHISFPPLSRLNVALKIKLLCFDYQHVQLFWNGFFYWAFFFFQYLLCVFNLESLSYFSPFPLWVTRKSPQKLSVLDLLIHISEEWEDFKCCFVQHMQNITHCLSLFV